MPFPVPGVAENTERQLRDIANALPEKPSTPALTAITAFVQMPYPAWLTGFICIRGGYSVRCFLIRRTLNIWSCTVVRAMFFVKGNGLVRSGGDYRYTGKTLPAGAEIRGEGVGVTTTAECTIGDEGSAEVTVKAPPRVHRRMHPRRRRQRWSAHRKASTAR